jgi:hypothetical protein
MGGVGGYPRDSERGGRLAGGVGGQVVVQVTFVGGPVPAVELTM